MVGLLGAFALLLAGAGVGKFRQPGSAGRAIAAAKIPGGRLLARPPVVRLTGAVELLIGGYVIGWGGPVSAALLAVSYGLLTAIAWRMVRVAPGQDCGCFGRSAEPITRWHLAVDGAGVPVGAAAVLWPQPSVASAVSGQGAQGVAVAVLTILLAWLCFVLMTALPDLLDLRTKVTTVR